MKQTAMKYPSRADTLAFLETRNVGAQSPSMAQPIGQTKPAGGEIVPACIFLPMASLPN